MSSNLACKDPKLTRLQIVVRGPAVAGGEARLDVLGTIRNDNTLAYL